VKKPADTPLFDQIFAGTPEANRAQQIEHRFHKFDRENPKVWNAFQRYAFKAIKLGQSHYSADAILHLIRWNQLIRVRTSEAVKINNDYASWYARKFHDYYPQHSDFFETRKQTSKERPARAIDQVAHLNGRNQ